MRFVAPPRLPFYLLLVTAIGATLAAVPAPVPNRSAHAAFLVENEAAMARMMAAMHVTPTGDIDRDFATMMIPHHQGAVEMAVAELRYGSDPVLRRLAQEIIIEQQQEIRVMQRALAEASQPTAPQGDAGNFSQPAPGGTSPNRVPTREIESPSRSGSRLDTTR